MGFPLSRFEQLSELSSVHAQKSFERFRLTAIVLHEYYDDSFRTKMQGLFRELDKLTGENFLFVTFIDPPKEWDSTNTDFIRQCMRNLSAEKGMDDIVVLSKFKRAFHLEYEKLPVILLTTNLNGKEFLVLKTSEDKIEKQLIEIGFFCNQQKQRPDLDDDSIKNLLRNLGGGYDVHINTPISNIICDADAEQGGSHLPANSNLVNKIKMKRLNIKFNLALSMLDSCAKEISRQTNAEDESLWTKYDKVIQQIADCFPALSGVEYLRQSYPSFTKKRKRHPLVGNRLCGESYMNTLEDQFSITKMGVFSGCENDTIALCKQYEMIASSKNPLSEVCASESDFPRNNVQYTTLAFLLGKMFETEITYSVVQMMRFSMGIEMPYYFCSYQNGRECIIPGDHNVDLNRNCKNQWEAPTLGQSLFAYKYLQNNPRENFDNWGNEFVMLWGRMKDWRNNASHSRFLDAGEFSMAHGTFVRLQSDFFERMMQMKMNLKNKQ